MNNQPNEMVRREWLLPLLDQQLSIVSDGWQADAHPDFDLMAQSYHQISNTLTMINLPLLAALASQLSWSVKVVGTEVDTGIGYRLVQFAHQLLRYELTYTVQTGACHEVLLHRAIQQLAQDLKPKNGPNNNDPALLVSAYQSQHAQESINIDVSKDTVLLPMQPEQYQQLLLAWRQQTQQLLATNRNQVETLASLEKASHYLWQTSTSQNQQRLWYLTALWLQNMLDNDSPIPASYAHLLSRLEQIIVKRHRQALATDGQTSSDIQQEDIEGLIADIFIQLNLLKSLNLSTQSLISHSLSKHDSTMRFLPRILADLESVIFDLEEPQALTRPLQDIKRQLGQRGWVQYESHIDQILSDIDSSLSSEDAFAQMQWQIERQLQESYSSIYNTEQLIQTNIDETTAPSSGATVSGDNSIDAKTVSFEMTFASTLRHLRLALEDVKNNFKQYLQQPHKQTYLLAISEAFVEIGEVLDNLELPLIRQINNQMADLFAQMAEHKVERLSKELVEVLVQGIASFDLLLSYLGHQVLDQQLLAKIDAQLEKAGELLDVLITAPDTVTDTYQFAVTTASNEVRYDDTGEIAPNDSTTLDDLDGKAALEAADKNQTAEAETTSDVLPTIDADSKALHPSYTPIQSDDFEVGEDIRDIFAEEAAEIIEDLDDFVSIWQQDAQDLTPLIEVRRGFHSLKGAGRQAGAYSISEIAWALENLLNKALDMSLAITDEMVGRVVETTAQLPTMVASFLAKQAPHTDPATIILQINNLATGQALDQNSEQPVLAESDANQSSHSTEAPLTLASQSDPTHSHVINEATAQSSLAPTDSAIPAVLEPFMQEALQSPADDHDIDADIKEIFIEEAEEVLAEIIPLYNRWCDDTADLTKLKEVRRGFHTLKGSGRMVGAHYTGELAWAIENMLNRILEHSIDVSAGVVQLIDDVLLAYPNLVDIFARSSSSQDADYPEIVSLWIACAGAYSKQYGDEFSYAALRKRVPAKSDTNLSADNAKIDSTRYCSDIVDSSVNESVSPDPALASIHSVNEMMADASAITTPQSSEEQAFCAIFIEEAQELLQDVKDFVNAHREDSEVEVADEIVRAFHTLRSSSGSSALSAVSQISATIEQSLMQLQQQDILMSAQHLQALCQSVLLIENYLNNYTQDVNQQGVPVATLQNQDDLVSLQVMLGEPDETETAINNELMVANLLEADVDGLLDAEWQLQDKLTSESTTAIQDYAEQQIYQIEQLIEQATDSPKFTSVLNALHAAYKQIRAYPDIAEGVQLQQALLAGHQQLISLFDAIAAGMSLKVDQQVLIDLKAITDSDESLAVAMPENIDVEVVEPSVDSTQAETLQTEAINTDIELLEIFLEETQELDGVVAQTFNKWRTDLSNHTTLKTLQRHMHTIKGGAQMAGIRSIGDLTHMAENIYEAFDEQELQPTPQWLTIMQVLHDTLSLQIDYVERYQESFFANELIEQLQGFQRANELPTAITLILPALYKDSDEDLAEADTADTDHAVKTDSLADIIAESWAGELPDADILEVFLEEADEIIESSNKYLQLFLSNISDVAALQALQRDLHTIKGGARMVTANGIADLAHEMETVYEELAIRRRPATKMVSQLLMACHDWLADAVYILKQKVNPPLPTALIAALKQFSKNPDNLQHVPRESLQEQRSMISAAKQQQRGRVTVDINDMPPMTGSFETQEKSDNYNEVVRISGSLVEHMINLSGESAINRARIDMGMSSLTNSIEEMGTTVQRLADQLRRMETELEEQILSQIDDRSLMNEEGFDPLEMDQYSSLNQLSKSLTESASDLIDIKGTLLEKTRDNESLLLQLSRTQAELQDGLMNSRMVPFTRVVPRLERIVRQTAHELNKSVELNIVNADDEIDRTILERITSPLEHMLRNAIDHGIENTQARLRAGKARSGQINLDVIREGSEIVIHLSDDGHGINVEAVKNKAIEQGLIAADDDSLSDLDIMQYIFNAGLTTNKRVTQISGRGVGMNVVISEIRQLGGSVSVSSEEGKGSRFTIRMPLTVAISDALVVRAADRYYAIPLVQIERVIRVNPESLYDYYESGVSSLRIEGEDYRIRYLNEILSGNKLNELMVSTNTSLPVIVIKNRTGQKTALQVDQIAGSRIEVVVKPLGRQLANLAGISAATIMGDGSVLPILDPMALMRNAPVVKDVKKDIKVKREDKSSQTRILVVDDSVTVRKVTSRLLERQGINVAVAKDGIDAIEILQEMTPDLILLDIEMPRMDGFEVTTQVRHNKRLRDIPIIMITSRTGEKHQERAFKLGVNDYMGKPFQENELLDKIEAQLGYSISLSQNG